MLRRRAAPPRYLSFESGSKEPNQHFWGTFPPYERGRRGRVTDEPR